MNRIKKRQLKKRVYTLLTVFILLALMGVALFLFQKPVIRFSNETRFPVGQAVSLSDLVLDIKNGTLDSENEIFEAQSAGTKSLEIRVKDRLGQITTHYLTIEFYDAQAPQITSPDEIAVVEGETVDLLEKVSAADETGEVCRVVLSGEYDFNAPGEYILTLSTTDRAGNQNQKALKLTVLPLPYDKNGNLIDGIYTTKNGFEMVVKDGICTIDGNIIVNKSYSINKNYTSAWMTEETRTAYSKMAAEANKVGISLPVDNAYRDWTTQNVIFRGYANRDGVEEAEKYSARPGHSEHQTGLAIDLVTSSTYLASLPDNAKALKWLSENAYRFGFILRYPEGKTNETGYIYEAWHYRYVGEELAKILYNNGDWITMEAYYGLKSEYRGYN